MIAVREPNADREWAGLSELSVRGLRDADAGALLDSVAEANPQLGTLVDLLNGPNRSGLCPSSSQEEGGTGG